jgi:hypothetical protein
LSLEDLTALEQLAAEEMGAEMVTRRRCIEQTACATLFNHLHFVIYLTRAGVAGR